MPRKSSSTEMNRRQWITAVSAVSLAGNPISSICAEPDSKIKPKTVAAVVTVYRKKSHADVILGKILEGWKQDGGPGPALKLASLYVEQKGADDLSVDLSRRFNFPMFDSIEKTLTVGGDRIPVDGVLSIGEHGDYPWNDKGQHLYPRRRFMDEICKTFEKFGRVVPVFNDKHLGPDWEDGKWMYDRARELKVPFMAGSSLVVTYRQPDLAIPLNSDIEAAVGIGYSGLDVYGAHALDCYQAFVERRRGGETGVKSVQCLQGEAMLKRVDEDNSLKSLFESALAATTTRRDNLTTDKQAALFSFEYVDGFRGALFMLPETGNGTSIAVKLKGNDKILATRFEERPEPYHPHFAYLLKGIERMIHTGQPSYPAERVLLTSGILDRALVSKLRNNEKLDTPELNIRYRPVDYPHAPRPDLDTDPTRPL
jgi:hypothetical protein